MDMSLAKSISPHKPPKNERPYYIITPTKSAEDLSAEDIPLKVVSPEEVIKTLVGKERIYAFGEKTHHRKEVEPGDWICFYASGMGIVAHAKVASIPQKKEHPSVHHPEQYPWVFHLSHIKVYTECPVVLDAQLRDRLDAYKGRSSGQRWSWFVQRTRLVTEHDFRILTRYASTSTNW
jgi:hypothetical protein